MEHVQLCLLPVADWLLPVSDQQSQAGYQRGRLGGVRFRIEICKYYFGWSQISQITLRQQNLSESV